MLTGLGVGRLIEPMTGRQWDRTEIFARFRARIAHFERQGLARHERVLLHYGNTPEFFADLLAIWHLGACAIPIDGRLTPFEVATLAAAARPKLSLWNEPPSEACRRELVDAGARVLLTGDADAAVLDTGAFASSRFFLDDDALILFTSGTTGQPKGVVHTHRSLRARWASLHSALGTDAFERTLCILPTHFGHGLICNCLFPWLNGHDLHIAPPFRADIVAQLGGVIDDFAITFMSSVPTVWRLAMKTARPPQRNSLRRVFCGSAPLTASLWQQAATWTQGAQVLNAYGITETGSWLAGTTMTSFERADGLIGEAWGGALAVMRGGEAGAAPGWSEPCNVDEPGYVWVNTPALMRGYLDREDLTRECVSNGWFSTGDIGVLDERGWLSLRGRVREEINKAGMKIYPGDVDAVIERFEHTVDVCAFAFADPLLGEEVGVAVVLQSSDDVVLGRLQQWTAAHLAVHQMPKRWYVVDEIPRTSRGKVNRRDVAGFCENRTPVRMPG